MPASLLAARGPSQPSGAHPSPGEVSARSKAVTFDPFGDFATEGYLRNVEKEKDLDIVKRLEHASFTTGLDEAFTALGKSRQFSYSDVLQTHGILFNAVYPWAGQDRLSIASTLCPQGTRHFCQPLRNPTCRRIRVEEGAGKGLSSRASWRDYGVPCLRPSVSGRQRAHDRDPVLRAGSACRVQRRLVSDG